MNDLWFYVVWILGAFFVGSISTGDIIATAKGFDIRSLGTGNPGAANIYREVGPVYGVTVFLLDVAIGASATVPLLLMGLPSWLKLAATIAVIGGHLFPVFWRFKGGTGMAVALGTLVGLLPIGVLISAPLGVAWFSFTRNPGYTGGILFGGTALTGGLLHRDWIGVLAVSLAAVLILAKSLRQYRGM